MGSDSVFGEPFYKEVPCNKQGQIDLPVGTKVKLKGKHCVVTEGWECHKCALYRGSMTSCNPLACLETERADNKCVHFEEIEE